MSHCSMLKTDSHSQAYLYTFSLPHLLSIQQLRQTRATPYPRGTVMTTAERTESIAGPKPT